MNIRHTHNIENVKEQLDQLNFQAKAQAEIERSAAIQNLLASMQSDEGIYTHAHITCVYNMYAGTLV